MAGLKDDQDHLKGVEMSKGKAVSVNRCNSSTTDCFGHG